MKISKSDLKQIIKEEAVRLYQIEKLEEAKKAVDANLKLVAEGKKKMTDEELEEIWAGLKSVLGAGAKAAGQAVQAGVQKAQQVGQKVVDTYKQGEANAKIQALQKQQADLTAKLNNVNAELSKLQPAPAAAPAAKAGRGRKAAATK